MYEKIKITIWLFEELKKSIKSDKHQNRPKIKTYTKKWKKVPPPKNAPVFLFDPVRWPSWAVLYAKPKGLC